MRNFEQRETSSFLRNYLFAGYVASRRRSAEVTEIVIDSKSLDTTH